MDSIVFVVEAGATVTLPGSGVEDGQIYFIRNHCGGDAGLPAITSAHGMTAAWETASR